MQRRHASTGGRDVQLLEPRRLLSFAPIGSVIDVPQSIGASAMDLAVADDGSALVALVTGEDENSTLTAVRYAADGTQIGAPLALGYAPARWDISADMDPDGDAVIAYRTVNHIEVRRISSAGEVSEPLIVSPAAQAPQFFKSPAVSMDDSGGFFVGWVSDHTNDIGFKEMSVNLRAYDAQGSPRGPAFVVATSSGLTTTYGQLDIAAEPDGSGAVYVFDHHGDLPGGLFFGRASMSERLRSDPILHTGFYEIGNPSIAMHADGSYLVGYSTFWGEAGVPGDPFHGFARRYNAADELQGEPILLDQSIETPGQSEDDGAFAVDVDAMGDGGFATIFHYQGNGFFEPDYVVNTFARRFDAAGTSDSAGPVQLQSLFKPNPNLLSEAGTAVAADDHGRVLVAYGELTTAPVRLRRFLAAEDAPVIEDGVLRVSGTAAGDAISIRVDGDSIIVARNGLTHPFPAADVDAIAIDGFDGDDTIINDTSLPSTILGGAGRDKLLGGSGNDSLCGGDGKDKLLGRDGNDALAGNAGNDTLEGGLQADRLRGHGGRDRLYGNGGNDRIFGGMQGDWLYGQGGDDHLLGDGGNDRLYGDHEAGGVDTLRGGAGDDLLVTRDTLLDHLFGGRGTDTSLADDADDVLAGIESAG